MIGGLIFDLDGVVFESEPIHRRAWMSSMQGFGHTVPEESLIEWTGIPCRDLALHYAETLAPRRDWREYHRAKGEAFRGLVTTELRPFPGVYDALHALAKRVPCGFATSNHRQDAELMLAVTGLDSVLTTGVTYDDVTEHKPSPQPYLEAARRIEVEPERCAVVEDSPSGVKAACNAGMIVAAVTTTFPAETLSGAERIFSSTTEACAWLTKLVDPSNRDKSS